MEIPPALRANTLMRTSPSPSVRKDTALILAVVLVVGTASGVVVYLVLAELLRRPAVTFAGDHALDILQNESYSELVIEVDWTSTEAPSQVALNTLAARLRTYTDKADVEILLDDVLTLNQTTFSPDDLFRVEQSHRDVRAEGTTFALYLLYVAGEAEDGARALGASFTGSSVAVFKEVVRRAARAAPQVSEGEVESSVLVHELGHLLGLVNLVYESDLDYEDAEHPFHSRNQSDVMFWALEVQAGFGTPAPTDFGFETRHDLERLRSGAYDTFPSRLRGQADALTGNEVVRWVAMRQGRGLIPARPS